MSDEVQSASLTEVYVNGANTHWSRLVELALSIPVEQLDRRAEQIARGARTGKSALKRKLEAIQWAYAKCHDKEAIVKAGQEQTLSRFIKSKKAERTEESVVMKWSISPDLKGRVQAEIWRIAKVLGFKTSEEYWEFMHSVMQDWDEATLNHLAGEGQIPQKIERKGAFTPIPAEIRKKFPKEACEVCGTQYVTKHHNAYNNTFTEKRIKEVFDHIFPRRWCHENGLDEHKIWNFVSLCEKCHGIKTPLEADLWRKDSFTYIESLKRIGYPMERVRNAAEQYGLKEIYSWTL